jgi:hypothetical protein
MIHVILISVVFRRTFSQLCLHSLVYFYLGAIESILELEIVSFVQIL